MGLVMLSIALMTFPLWMAMAAVFFGLASYAAYASGYYGRDR
jgi:hypothetical protein